MKRRPSFARPRPRAASTPKPATLRDAHADKLVAHVERYLGPIAGVLRGIETSGLRIDLLWVPPELGRTFHTLVTCGMSGRPMQIPDPPCDCGRWAELLLRLPGEWPVGPAAPDGAAVRWPIEQLTRLALYPHHTGRHFGPGHTIALLQRERDDTPTPVPGRPFAGWALRVPDWAPRRFRQVRIDRTRTIDLLGAIALYADELAHAYAAGTADLFEHFDAAGVTDLLDPGRPDAFAPLH